MNPNTIITLRPPATVPVSLVQTAVPLIPSASGVSISSSWPPPRTCGDRRAGDGGTTIAEEMAEVPGLGQHLIEVRDRRGRVSQAILELQYRQIQILPPVDKPCRTPALTLTVLPPMERGRSWGRDPIVGKLVTHLPIHSRTEAIERLEWYALRWKIEVFHKILKSGCQAERSKLRTAEPPAFESRPIELALYFPLLKDWRHWQYGDGDVGADPKKALFPNGERARHHP